MNWSNLGRTIISVLLFSDLPISVLLSVLGTYSERPPAVILDGLTANLVWSILTTEVARNADRIPVIFN